jgi:tRNA threonylcarbamoyladenosine biosynthesis protein TsaE
VTSTRLSTSQDDTEAIGAELASHTRPGTVVLLFGNLGAGKTAFVRGLAKGLGADPGDVSSPTFTLVQEYRGGRLTLAHADLFRLDHPREIDDLGLDEIAAAGVLAIEWAEKLTRPSPQAIHVRIDYQDDDRRAITIFTPSL